MIVVFGSINVDLIFAAPKLPAPGETVLAASLLPSAGGKGANQAVAAARDGAQVLFAGAVGNDAFAQTALAGLAAARVNVDRVVTVPDATGCACIVTSGGRNQIIVAAGANAHARAVQLEEQVLVSGNIVLVQMETDLMETAALIGRAAARGARVILNLAPMQMLPLATLKLLYLLVVNEAEAAGLALLLGCAPSAAGLNACLGIGVIRTLGAAGVEAVACGAALFIPAVPVAAIDSTAAGDCFVGVMAAALDRGLALPAALRRATAAAALCCLRPGSQDSLPDAAATDEMLRELL